MKKVGRVAVIASPGPIKLACFSSPCVALAGATLPITFYLPQFYAGDMGLGLGLVGTIFMVVRLFSTLADPIIGYLSDNTISRFGRRKPWIAAGGLIFLGGTLTLFAPLHKVSSTYLAFSLALFCGGWTLIATPLYAWSGDFAKRYNDHTRIQAFLQTATALGLMLVLLVVSIEERRHGLPITKIHLLGLFIGVTLSLGLPYILASFTDAGRDQRPRRKIPTVERFAALKDPLVLRVMSSDFCVSFGQGIRTALFVFFVTADLGEPRWASTLFLLQASLGIFANPLWLKLSYRLGQRQTLIAGELTQVVVNLSLLAVTRDRLWLMVLLIVAQGLSQGSGNLMLRAMIADLADAHRTKTGQESAGILFSIFNVTFAAASAIAVGTAFPLLSWYGFVPGGASSAHALTILQIVFAVGPALGHALSALLILQYPTQRTTQKPSRPTPLFGEPIEVSAAYPSSH